MGKQLDIPKKIGIMGRFVIIGDDYVNLNMVERVTNFKWYVRIYLFSGKRYDSPMLEKKEEYLAESVFLRTAEILNSLKDIPLNEVQEFFKTWS